MKPGPKPKSKINLNWRPEFAYVVGLITADGCLSKDRRHINITSVDIDLLNTFNNCLGTNFPISEKFSGLNKKSYFIQFSDVIFYDFLNNIGLFSAKSKTIKEVLLPKEYFIDFLRGYFDGDGTSYSYYDSRYKFSYRFYISFACGSKKFIEWLREINASKFGVRGFINEKSGTTNVQLKYSKREAVILAKKMYYHIALPCLLRKKKKIDESLDVIENTCRSGETGRHAAFRAL